MKNTWIFPAAALAVGVVGGYISGKNNSAAETGNEPQERTVRTRPLSRESDSQPASSSKSARKTMEEISRMPGNSDRIRSMIDHYASLSPAQLEDEAKKLDALPMNERMLAAFLLFGRWGEVDATAAMSFANTMGFAGGFTRPMILQSWASNDPAAAAQYLEDNPREFAMMNMFGGGRGRMGGNAPSGIIASEWAKQDPEGAMKWAAGLQNGGDQAKSSIISEVAKTDPKKAIAMLSSMEGDKGRAYESVAASYATRDFAGTKTWIQSLPADEQQDALGSAIRSLSNVDPQSAAREVAGMAEGRDKERAIGEIAGDMARINPSAAGEFVKSQTAEAQEGAVRELMPAWVAQDAAGALSFANSLQGEAKDDALGSYVMSNTTSSPSDLVKVAESIQNENQRSRTVAMTAARWMRENPEGAKSYIQQSPFIADGMKENLLNGNGPWGRGRDRRNR